LSRSPALDVVTLPDTSAAGRRTVAARGALWLSLSSWTARIAQTAMLLVLARALAPAEFGILAVAALTYNVLTALTQLGVADALTYFKDRIDEATRTALSMLIVGGLLLLAVTWVMAPFIAHFFHSEQATFVLRGFALGIPFEAVSEAPVGRLTRSLSFSRRALTDTLPSVIGAAVTIGVVLAGYPLIGLVVGQVVGAVASAGVAMLVGPRCLPGWNTEMARQLLRYGGFVAAADVINLALLNVDYILVGHVLGPYALGLYSLAYRICFMPYVSIAIVMNGAVFPYYCRLPSLQAKARTAENVFLLIAALSIPWFTGLVLFANDIVILGSKWAPAAGAVRFLAVYGFVLSLILSALQVLKAAGRADLVLLGRLLHLAILATVLIATIRAGITVVALDQALVACAIAIVCAVWVVRYASLRLVAIARSTGLPLLCALGMVAVVLLARLLPALHRIPSWGSLLVLGLLSLAAFAGGSLMLMPHLLRAGWAAVRGRSESPSDDPPDKASNNEPSDEDPWDAHTAKGLEWLVERRLIAPIVENMVAANFRSFADFACGTGRIMEFVGDRFPSPTGIDVSRAMLELAGSRCPQAVLIHGDVTVDPGLAPGPFDLITAFGFLQHAEPALRSQVLTWMRKSLRPGGAVVANFQLNPASLRGRYLRLRPVNAARPAMMSIKEARELFEEHGFTVCKVLGYGFLPYRRDGRAMLAPSVRRAVETRLAGSRALLPTAGSFIVVATLESPGWRT
jgi:O-antigen/teichoic acid export membrane protein/SAM-dependent methyltransferase